VFDRVELKLFLLFLFRIRLLWIVRSKVGEGVALYALLGSTREVTLPNEGVLSFAIPAGVQPGNTLHIADKGLPSCPEAKLPPSSILIQVNVTLPTIPEKHKEHTRKFFTLLSSSS
jgi:DnaJ-class molecular chaperone